MASDSNEILRVAEKRDQVNVQIQGRSLLLFVTLASIGDAVITTDEDGAVSFLNPAAEQLTGCELADAVGTEIEDVFKLVDETTGVQLPSPVRQALATMSKVDLPQNAALLRTDGTQVPVEDSAAPIVGTEGEVLGAILVFRDITERKKAEKMIRYRSELDRMAARVSTSFVTSPVSEVDSLIDEALRDIGQFLGADRSYVYLYSPDGSTFTCTHQWHAEGIQPFPRKPMQTAAAPNWTRQLLGREHIYVSGVEDIPPHAVEERELWMRRGVNTFIAVPMLQEGTALGFIGVDAVKEARPWPEEAVNLLYLMGNVFASAMARRDAHEKLEAAREREVQIGSRIQQILLLGEPPPAFGDLRVAAFTVPSRGVDGDFYDFLRHPNYCLDIIFGDVMGKGVSAALLAAGSKTEFLRNLSHLLVSSPRGTIPEPQDIVNSVHAIITPQLLDLDSFVTMSYVRFDPEVRKVIMVDCGNTRLIRCYADGSIDYLSGNNVPLGFSATEVYTQAEFDYTGGDTFVFYSDGITEARSPQGEIYTVERLQEVIAAKHHLAPERIIDAIKASVFEFSGTDTLLDDLTCVVVKVVPEAPYDQPAADEVLVSSSLDDLPTIRRFVRGYCIQKGCNLPPDELNLLELAVNEVASNIMRHGYHGRDDQRIWVRMDIADDMVKVRLSHNGDPFRHMGRIPAPRLDSSREGGFGLYIITHAVDGVDYGVDAEGRQYIDLTKHYKV